MQGMTSCALAVVLHTHKPGGLAAMLSMAALSPVPSSASALTVATHAENERGGSVDIWEDKTTLDLLTHGKPSTDITVAELQRLRRRGSRYRVQGQELYSLDADGKPWLVP